MQPEAEGASYSSNAQPSQFIGVIMLNTVDGENLALPEHLTIAASDTPQTVIVELGYAFLPQAWGKGYATESLNAALDTCRRATAFWEPYEKVYIRVIVNTLNPPSLRVMAKIPGMVEKGMFQVDRRVWLAGEWREHHDLHIFGMYLL